MRKTLLFTLLFTLSVLMNCFCLGAQTAGTTHSPADSIVNEQPPIADSVKLVEMKEALDEARINEMNLKLEIQAMKMASVVQDSMKLAQQRLYIDSLRGITIATPVVVEGDTLYFIYAKKGGVAPKERAENIAKMMLTLGKHFGLKPDSVRIESTEIVTELMYGEKVIASFTDTDGLWENSTRDRLAAERREIIVAKLHQLQKEHGIMQLLKRIGLFALVIAIQAALIWASVRLYRKIKKRILSMKDSKMKPISFRDYELLDTDKQVRLLVWLANLGKYILILIQLIISIPLLFSIFPQTQDFAYRIFSYIWQPVKGIAISVFNYLPNLFTIIVIWFAIRYLVKLVKFMADEIQAEKLKIKGFYPDWAQSTFQIVRFLLYAFMIAMIYPYFPGSDGGVFRGVSVFVGLVVSLGSTSVIGNLMAGLVITYMRPFKIGDRIKLNDTVGDVLEKTPFVTRIKTPKNEVITIPNSFIMSTHTVNYSSSARNYGLIIHAEITFGYEVHWQTVHELLIEAAKKTNGVMEKPEPFVLETSMKDFYAVYQINAYIKEAERQPKIYSELYHNIQDLASKAGVEMLSPHFIATRDGSEILIPKEKSEAVK